MNRKTLYILVIVIALAIVLISQLNRKITNNVNQLQNSTNTRDIFNFTGSAGGIQTYESKEYGFKINMPISFSYQIAENDYRYYPGILTTIDFREINPDTSEVKNRETPNGFNTSADNILTLLIYPNSDKLTSSEIEQFKVWHDQALIGHGIQSIDEVSYGDNQILYSIENNGVGDAAGRYYYLFSEDNIIVITSNDVSKDVMEEIVSSFTLRNN